MPWIYNVLSLHYDEEEAKYHFTVTAHETNTKHLLVPGFIETVTGNSLGLSNVFIKTEEEEL